MICPVGKIARFADSTIFLPRPRIGHPCFSVCGPADIIAAVCELGGQGAEWPVWSLKITPMKF